jgi:hypothetical protein
MAIAVLALVAGSLLAVYLGNGFQQTGEESLVDIKNIDTLRTQFNRDVGKIRLIILGSPT